MAGLSTRSRRNTQNNPTEEVNPPETVKDDSSSSKSRGSRSTKVLTVPVSPVGNNGVISSTVSEQSTVEPDSSSSMPSTAEEISSNASESGSGTSNKTTSETSVTSDETLSKTKEELIRTAHDLDAQLQELIKIYKDEKKLFLEKSINMLENESHPDWLERIEELRTRRHDAIKIANERRRLKVESILAEYDFALKNISDEFQAAENEIIDEFTSKRKRKTQKDQHKEFTGLAKIERAAIGKSAFGLDDNQVQNDLSAINRIIQSANKPSASPSANTQTQAEILM